MDLREEKRHYLVFHEPRPDETKEPKTKKEILKWYEKEKRILKTRLFRPVKIRRQFREVIVDRDTKKPLKRSKSYFETTIERWRLSQQDHDVYLGLLEQQFSKYKKAYNQRLKRRKEKEGGDSKKKR